MMTNIETSGRDDVIEHGMVAWRTQEMTADAYISKSDLVTMELVTNIRISKRGDSQVTNSKVATNIRISKNDKC